MKINRELSREELKQSWGMTVGSLKEFLDRRKVTKHFEKCCEAFRDDVVKYFLNTLIDEGILKEKYRIK